ncbi:transketolase [Johnsonella ignava ATCC 51276]|uniref:Transketolase n=1 Tax=Johnsonella ignava ATCC 51276 TaxID=679200 RepID=G5GHB9_9FIRM|nr:transketolase [Johnsonella ignava]EHI55916.1 transketolase [Johnsonella ignava ATCC 51276]
MNIENKAVNAIRILSADAVQNANSGHPGFPLGAAPIAYELWANHMKHNPQNPGWQDRDRFVLSGGHGSMLLYSLLHLFGYGNLSIKDLKNFRQLNSSTPGHPEYGHTIGVEATTGPLGAGMAMAVGMAMAEAHLSAVFNEKDFEVVDHFTYVLGGDGCLMEGISSEAFSHAGTLRLHKLIVLYDSNNITIEGSTDLAFTENVMKRMEAFGFGTFEVKDGNDLDELAEALKAAKADKTRPSFIKINTVIGFGCSQKQGKASAHGEPLGLENVNDLRKNLGWDIKESFEVPDEIYLHYKNIGLKKAEDEKNWNELFKKYSEKYPDKRRLWDAFYSDADTKMLDANEFWQYEDKPQATRNISGTILNRLKDIMPNLIGGSADLAPSNKSYMNGEGDFLAGNYTGRNIHFGVRELAMAGETNGILLHGGLRPYCATFFVFSDYTKPMLRLASLMGIPSIYIFTHDSIGVGEDGPTHEPVEQLAMLRAMPNFNAFRPADATETAAAWYSAVTSKRTPTAVILSRQNLVQLKGSSKDALKGAYIIKNSVKETPDVILMASGSEVNLVMLAAEKLYEENIDARVVSMPCSDIFDAQDEAYKEKILPNSVRKRIAVEALSSFGWERYTGIDGEVIAMNSFGASAPQDKLFKHFGFSVENIVDRVKLLFK